MFDFLPVLTAVVVALFAQQVLARWWSKRDRTHLLIWSIGLIFYGIGALSQSLYALFGWQAGWGEWNFRIWYLFGAVLVAAWLGQGTVFLMWKRFARPSFVILLLGSAFAAYWVFTAPINPEPLMGLAAELTGRDVLPPSARLITPIFNVYGVLTLVGGALWSSYQSWRTGAGYNRMAGNILIAAGALAAGAGGILNRFGLPGLYLGLFLGAFLMFGGFLAVTGRRQAPAAGLAPAERPVN